MFKVMIYIINSLYFFNAKVTFRNCAMLLKLTLFPKKNASFDRLAFYIYFKIIISLE